MELPACLTVNLVMLSLAVGCGGPGSGERVGREELSDPVDLVAQQLDDQSQGYRLLHQDDATADTMLRRVVTGGDIPAQALLIGGHLYFDDALRQWAPAFRQFYFDWVTNWHTVPEERGPSLFGEILARENLYLENPEDLQIGCWARAMLVSKVLNDLGWHSKKIWIENPRAGIGPAWLSVSWTWHAATAVLLETRSGEVRVALFDPVVDSTRPVELGEWLAYLNLTGRPVLEVESLTTTWPQDPELRWRFEGPGGLPELDHIGLSLSEWERYSIERCEPPVPCREDLSVEAKVQAAREELQMM